ncbi:membrane peptidoglycan carboxypeptidase [Pseudonocardia hierapolitana]|uniref:Membrane peptidoglycan carboxypeptidase n=1 Tax=Pseudonocardia hierapolitana TaxID=1128676 RepID=A0A561SSE4_9PSEU|nr:transglycosylase domain-containing protein [Pseudonocardia hierapolitana]TWF77755.1 membrane peptidoglycan carboxypeptidase [Pseudonocardia hierapolitana]
MSFPRHLARPIGLLLGLGLLAGVVVAGMTFPVAAGLGLVASDTGDSVNTVSADLVDGPLPQTTTVTDSSGVPIARFFEQGQNRHSVTADQISPAMKAAIVAIEDRRFYQHQGVDWQGTLRALAANSASGTVVQGASTLTQQYVKNYMLYVAAETETERLKATEQTPARKLKEAQIALQMEQRLSKDEILTRYLNIVSFGNGAAGIAAAARTYFNTTPDQLTVPQAALLAGMVNSTSAFDPVTNPQAALERRNLVIQQMRDQQMIDQAQAEAALAAPLDLADPLNTQPNGCIGAGDAGFFCKYVVEYLTEAGFSLEQLNRGGYTIKSTLDRNVLNHMKASLDAEVPPRQPNVANVMSVVQPGTEKHRVLGMASSRTFGLDAEEMETSYGLPYEPVNLGAGSTYKIFTAAAALEKGMGINYELSVPPSGYASPIYVDGAGRPLPVRNSNENMPERMSLTDALAQSPNTAFIKLEEFTGVPPVVDMAVRLGMRSLATTPFVDPRTGRPTDRSIAEVTKAQNLASFTLGVSPTSVLELANVGATLASAGKWCPPSPIESITDVAGNPVPVTEAPCEQAVEPGLANAMFNALGKDDLPGGTAAGAAGQVGWNRPMAGKTGTTQQHKSAAFVGFVPQMAGAVITFDNSRSPRPLCDGAGSPFPCRSGNIFGGKTPAETWFGAMKPLLDPLPPLAFPVVEDRFLVGGEESRIPDVIGDSENEAREELEEAGWQVSVREVDNAADRGTVVGQSPRGSALPGETVEISISSGEAPPAPDAPGDDDDDDDDGGDGD